MKRQYLILLITLLTIPILLLGCQKTKSENLEIGIVQYVEHPALDQARLGFTNYIDSLDLPINLNYQNAQADLNNSIKICEKFKKDKVDLIFAISSPAAQAAYNTNKEIPILFTAVTDPESLALTGQNISGTTDRSDIDGHLEIFKEIDKDIKNIGVIYNTGEANSLAQLEDLKNKSVKYKVNIIEKGISDINDLKASLESIVSEIDGFYLLSDNLTASSIGLISKILIENNIPSVSAEESQVYGGALISKSHSYYELGYETAKMAEKILLESKSIDQIPIKDPDNQKLILNLESLNKLDIDKDLEIFQKAQTIK